MIFRMEHFSPRDQSAFYRKLRELEAKLPRPTVGAVSPQGAVLQINVQAQVLFRDILKQLAPEVLYRLLDELREELQRRGLKE
jgi:hypothetical protein